MTEINKIREVPYTPRQMYDLVNDIESYPLFLPWCRDASILERQAASVTATLSLSLGGIRQSFTTKNTLYDGQRIAMQKVNGPFRELYGYWEFNPHHEYCQVRLYICYEFENTLLKYLLGKVFYKVADKLVEAFEQRAQHVYDQLVL